MMTLSLTQLHDAVIEMQTQMAFQEATVGELNKVVSEQQTEILTIKRQMKLLKAELDTALAVNGGVNAESGEPPPPHY